jgi:phosphoribosylformylglycinamidine synthase I
MNSRVCIIQFPGVNCEYETARALEKAGLGASIVRWNDREVDLAAFDGYVLPGGFSYEDRLRAGAIAASEDVLEILIDQAALGKPVVGICNGAQVLVESGLVPGIEPGRVDLALAPNKGMGRDGYYANWVYVRVTTKPEKTAITYDLKAGEIMPIPVAHSQGRFASADSDLFGRLEAGGQIVLKYCTPDGRDPLGFPDDPNGSERFAAAVSNVEGNVVAMMPHPERSAWLRQVPAELDGAWTRRRLDGTGSWERLEGDGPGAGIFRSLRVYIEEHRG